MTLAPEGRDLVGQMVDKSAPFAVRSTDVHSVASALSAAERSWKRGESAAVLRWVQRAAEAATEAEDDVRALELTKCARELAKQFGALAKRSPATPAPAQVPPPPASSSVHLLTKLAQPKSAAAASAVAAAAVTKSIDRESLAGEVSRGRLPSVFEEDTNQVAIFQLRGEAARKERDAAKRAKKPAPPEAPTRTHVVDEWSIETITGSDVSLLEDDEDDADADRGPPTPPTPPRVRVQPTQALRVLLWRDADGALYVCTAGAPAPPHAVQAVLTALDPDTDLLALLGDPPP